MPTQAPRDSIPGWIEGRPILRVEDLREQPGEDFGDSLVIYLPGMRLYVDAPSLYSDDSGDAVAAF